ncbi:uncharacterized protein [Triticum aestivum]|uniref:uncharacterized protein n=1 Tax=Triticum aestivum TaxID=4565 RepID=UPI001D00B872|nr:uncharacterized protein LOC123103351 [Triticum aestivum]
MQPRNLLSAAMVASNFSQTQQQIDKQPTFVELVRGTDRCKLADMHKEKVKALLICDPKRKALVPSRFCSFHLASFDHDEETKVPLGPPYESDAADMAGSSINVTSLRFVKAGPEHTYQVEVYGRVIAREEDMRLITNVSFCSIVKGRMPSSSIQRYIFVPSFILIQ